MKVKYDNAKRYRTRISRFLGILAVIALIFGETQFGNHPVILSIISVIGLLLCTSAVLGRIWCAFYISGFKNKKLVSEGPYSMCRNPLYYYSFLGSIGIGLASQSIAFFAVSVIGFALYYPFVIAGEEGKLENIYGDDYRAYKQKVPRFFPKFSLFHQPADYAVRPKSFYKDLRDSAMFIVVYGIIVIINALKAADVIPSFFNII